MGGGSRGSVDLRRKRQTRRENKRILIVAEGERTEVQYFKGLADYLRASAVNVIDVKIKGAGGGNPLSIVNRAIEELKGGPSIGDRDGYDAVWCVFDVDQHAKMREAIVAAKREKFKLAISNPCFEIWLLWHFCSCEKHVDSTYLRRELRKHGIRSKKIPQDFDFSLANAAIVRVKNTSSEMPANPGTGVVGLVSLLLEKQ
ncbi:RloB domain-containing protein [Amycolatopsis rubida]|uniref:RloB domain-containing protein n=1 Tax=Amycolatopsis rubida TaxID=112413 RepID=A0ABX0BS50_9PSEU|nr:MULTISPECIES: RloB family protein [Amycolatopsis]MYW93378.1 RloB domain-containing protein [Amycolatopsis rubida]NEC58365.1 RloB domain-containing protein [Amycolatopsis rubida]